MRTHDKSAGGRMSSQIPGLSAERKCRHDAAKLGGEPRTFRTPASIIPEPEMLGMP